MALTAHEPALVPLHAVTPAEAAEAAQPLRHTLFNSLDPAISLVRDWPLRIALIVGQALHPAIMDGLVDAGISPILVSVDRAMQTLQELAPVAFFLCGPDVFAGDESVKLVRSWHRVSPMARLSLVCPRASRDSDVLVRAIRAGVTDVVDPADMSAFRVSLCSAMLHVGATRERVLAIGAHPDDVEIGCGGTLLDHRRRGDRISILTLSRGAVGGAGDARLREATATAETIGAQLLFGDEQDTSIDEGITTIRLIESVVAALDPTVVYVHSAHDNHQDHRAVHTATRSATRGVRRVFAYQSPSATNDFMPTQFVSVDDTVRRKVEVLQMFGSQEGRSYLEPELVIAGARYWARHLGANARYAEPYEVIRSVGALRQLPTRAVEVSPLTNLAMSTSHLSAVPPMIDSSEPDLYEFAGGLQ